MTTPARLKEAEAAEVAFHTALAQLGAESVQEALQLWQHMPASQTARVRDAWLRQAVRLVMGRRGQSRLLARAFYRLVRALRTGTTVADPSKPEPRYITLNVLRQEFEALVPKPASRNAGQEPASTATPPTDTPESDNAPGGRTEPDERILVEKIEALDAEQERQEREAEQEALIDLDALGPSNLEKKNASLDPEAPASEIDAARNDAHAQAGARQAAAAARIAKNGAHAEIWTNASKDKRVLGYVRYSTTGTPCGWCAMLISRGAVYKSEASATYDDGDLYHDNCNCSALPVFSKDQYNSDPKYDLNRTYAKQWPEVTRGLSGKAAVSAWRRFIRQQQADVRAQAAQRGSTSNAQEASS